MINWLKVLYENWIHRKDLTYPQLKKVISESEHTTESKG